MGLWKRRPRRERSGPEFIATGMPLPLKAAGTRRGWPPGPGGDVPRERPVRGGGPIQASPAGPMSSR